MERLTIKRLQKGYKEKEFSPVEITKQYFNQIYINNPRINAFITISEEVAIHQAKILEQKLMAGFELGKLFGVPVSFKDNILTKGILTTNGSYIHRNQIPDRNASIVQQTINSDGIIVGKNNLHEFALGITSNNPHYGPVRNPWNLDYTPGGSSGGSASAVASNLSVFSFGTDTGASVRLPAASCGVIGLKPTRGLLPTNGVTNISWTLDHVGPITANMSDLAIVMETVTNESYSHLAELDIKGLKIGIPTTFFNEKVDPSCSDIFKHAIQSLETSGAIIEDIEMPEVENYLDFGFAIAIAEVGYIHKENIKYKLHEYGSDVKELMASTSKITLTDYFTALKAIEKYEKEFKKIFHKIDIMATLTMPSTTQKIGVEEILVNGVQEDLFAYMNRNTMLFNMIGFPALSLPCGLDKNGLPVGLQLIASPYREDLLIKTGFIYEESQLEDLYKIRDTKCLTSKKI